MFHRGYVHYVYVPASLCFTHNFTLILSLGSSREGHALNKDRRPGVTLSITTWYMY